MIGTGLKKLAAKHGMTVANGVAYGNLRGYATTLSEGAGYKQIDISTQFTEVGKLEQLQAAVNAVETTKTYRVQKLGFGNRWISIIFNDTIGTMKKIEAFIDWFYPLLEQHGATRYNMCAHCGGETATGSWYLIDGIAHYLHESCADGIQNLMQEENQTRKVEDNGSYIQGFLGAFLGAALGSIVWALVLSMGFVASIIGFVIGWLAEKGYNLLGGKQGKGKIAILILVIIFGVLLGTLIPDAVTLAQMINSGEVVGYVYGDIPSMIIYLLQVDSEYLGATAGNVLLGLLFAGLGVFSLLRKTNAEVADRKIVKLK